MQYDGELKSYVRIKNEKKIGEEINLLGESYFALICILIVGFLLARVVIPMNFTIIKTVSPFGIAYLLAFSKKKNNKEMLVALIGTIMGYLTIINIVVEVPIYILLALITIGINYFSISFKKTILNIIKFASFLIVILAYSTLILGEDLYSGLAKAIIVLLFIIPSYFLLTYSIECIGEIKSNHYFSTEEIISIELLLSLIIVGVGSISIFNIDVREVLAIVLVTVFTYIIKGNMGATVGLVMGMLLGVTTKDFNFTVTIYAISALTAAIFKEGGKLLTYLAFSVTFILVSFYSGVLVKFTIYELLIGAVIFFIIPNRIMEKATVEFDDERKKDEFNNLHFNRMKTELSSRLRDFTDVLTTMSKTLNTIVENENLVKKNKGEALINNLADRVCSDCDYKNICWKREMHETYSAFSEVIENFEEGRASFPAILERKCLKKTTLIKVTAELVNNYILQETIKQRLGEGRKLLASHLNNMSLTIDEVVDDFNKEISLTMDVQRSLRKELIKNDIEFKDLFCYSDKDGRVNIKIEMTNCSGGQYCVKKALPIINKALGKAMVVASECNIDPKTESCEILIEEAPKYHVTSNVSLLSKDGENQTGDSYSILKSKNGNHMALLCDGMGSGERAGAESRVTVEMMEKFSEVGFSEITAIDTINSIMSIKFSEEEKFSTLDMQKINLYTGDVRFIKVGAVESFIKRGRHIEVIESKTLPFGVLDSPDIDILDKKLKGGEFIITISDGILDVNADGNLDNQWIIELLRLSRAKTAKELSNEILTAAKEKSAGKVKDDMTVLVSKVYNLN